MGSQLLIYVSFVQSCASFMGTIILYYNTLSGHETRDLAEKFCRHHLMAVLVGDEEGITRC